MIGIAWQQLKEPLEALDIEAEHRRQLPQKRAGLVAKVGDAGGEKVGERRFDVAKLQHVRDKAWTFDAEDEIRRCLIVPARIELRTLQRVERSVDFDRRKFARCVVKLGVVRQIAGIEHAAPWLVAPARD